MLIEDFIKQYSGDKFACILADPPWEYNNRGRGAACREYNVMSIDKLKEIEVNKLASENSVLFMWTTFPQIENALELFKAWGFEYKTGAAWHKLTKTFKTYFGTGFYFRSASELLLLGIKGHPKLKTRDTRNIIQAVCLGHSIKPDIQYNIIESMFDGPYLEIFARRNRKGWTTVGNEL